MSERLGLGGQVNQIGIVQNNVTMHRDFPFIELCLVADCARFHDLNFIRTPRHRDLEYSLCVSGRVGDNSGRMHITNKHLRTRELNNMAVFRNHVDLARDLGCGGTRH